MDQRIMDQPTMDQPIVGQASIDQPGTNQPTIDPPNPLPLSCPDCDARMPETAAFCPGCGRSMSSAAATAITAQGKVGLLAENLAGALAYLTFIPAIIFLFVEPYKKNRFVRFHSVQCLLLCATVGMTALAIRVAAQLLFFIPLVGPLFVWLVAIVIALAAVVVWVVLVVKAVQGETFKLPVLGDFAEREAGSV